jgi:hypothetical protein
LDLFGQLVGKVFALDQPATATRAQELGHSAWENEKACFGP